MESDSRVRMINYFLAGIGVISLLVLLGWYFSRHDSGSSVIDVRATPERRIEELTVEEMHETVQSFLMDEDYRLEEGGEHGDYLAYRDDEVSLVRVDPAAEYGDPRRMNRMILNLRQSEADSGIILTTRPVKGQSQSLARKASIRVIGPAELLDSPSSNQDEK